MLIDGERIAAVGDYRDVAAQAGDAVVEIDLNGGYVTPGLVNMHTHFSLSLPGAGGDAVKDMGPHDLALYMADGARRALLCGVTTVRCVAEKDHADFALRRAIESGRATGPRIYTAGRALVCTGGHGHESNDTLECDGADSFRRGVRAQRSAGADLIKVMISGGIAGEHEQISTRQLFPDELAAVLDTAHAWGMKVTAHAGPAEVIGEAVDLGLDCVEHGYQLTEEVVAKMAARGTALVPTLVVTRCGAFFDQLGVPAWMQARSLGAAPRHDQSFRLAVDAGVEILLGSDMPPFWEFEGTNATVRELEHMAEVIGPERASAGRHHRPDPLAGRRSRPGDRRARQVRGPHRHARRSARLRVGLPRRALGDEGRHRGQGRGAQMSFANAAAAIASGIDDMYVAFLDGDRRRFDSHLHDDVTVWETHVPDGLMSRNQLDDFRSRRNTAGARPQLARLEATEKRDRRVGDTGLARYELISGEDRSDNGAQRARVTDVFRRIDGRWLIVHHHAEAVQDRTAVLPSTAPVAGG